MLGGQGPQPMRYGSVGSPVSTGRRSKRDRAILGSERQIPIFRSDSILFWYVSRGSVLTELVDKTRCSCISEHRVDVYSRARICSLGMAPTALLVTTPFLTTSSVGMLTILKAEASAIS